MYIFWIIPNPHASLFWQQPNRQSELPAILKSLKDWMRMAERRCLAKSLGCDCPQDLSVDMVVLSDAATLNIPHYSSFIIFFPIWSTTWGVFSCMFPLPSGGMPHFQTYPKPPQNVGKTMCCPIILPFSPMFCGVIPPVSRVPKPPVGSGASSSQPGAQLLAAISQEDGVAAEVD